METSEPCVCHLVAKGGCRQGRSCPVREIEMSNDAALDPRCEFPAPKGKRMQYRLSSSALTGRAARTMAEAFGCHPNDPLHPIPDKARPGLGDFFAAVGQVIARLFGR